MTTGGYRRSKTKTLPTPDWLREEAEAAPPIPIPESDPFSLPPLPEIATSQDDPEYESKWLDRRVKDLSHGQVLLRPEDLNALFNPVGLDRLALRESPMLGTCCLFNLDSTLLPSWSVDAEAWKTVEEEEDGLEAVFEVDERAGMKVEEIVRRKYGVRDFAEARRIGLRFFEARQSLLAEYEFEPYGPALGFLRLLSSTGCTMGGYTRLPAEFLPRMVEKLEGLLLASTITTPDSSYETPQQTLLGCSLSTRVAPLRTVVFDPTPPNLIASHDAGMRCIAVGGSAGSYYPAYEMKVADLRVDDWEDLRVQNVAAIVAEAVGWGEQEQEMEMDVDDGLGGGGGGGGRGAIGRNKRWD